MRSHETNHIRAASRGGRLKSGSAAKEGLRSESLRHDCSPVCTSSASQKSAQGVTYVLDAHKLRVQRVFSASFNQAGIATVEQRIAREAQQSRAVPDALLCESYATRQAEQDRVARIDLTLSLRSSVGNCVCEIQRRQ